MEMKQASNLLIQEAEARRVMKKLTERIIPLAEKNGVFISGIVFDSDYVVTGSPENILKFFDGLWNETSS